MKLVKSRAVSIDKSESIFIFFHIFVSQGWHNAIFKVKRSPILPLYQFISGIPRNLPGQEMREKPEFSSAQEENLLLYCI